jgi:AcrR family transcriptional regulator
MSPVSQSDGVRPLRADARRNRDALLAAAAAVFAESGADAPLDDVARRAGVGNATLYRHFPTRRELLVAVYADEVDALCVRGRALLESRRPADALFDWLAAFAAHVAAKRELAAAVPDDSARSALFDGWHAAMHEIAAALLTRAEQSGEIAADVAAADLLALTTGIALTGPAGARAERLLRLVRQGATGFRTPG